MRQAPWGGFRLRLYGDVYRYEDSYRYDPQPVFVDLAVSEWGGAEAIGELEKDAFHFLQLLRFQLANAIAEFHGRRRLDEQRGTGRRRVVYDAARRDASLAAHRNHVSPVAQRDRHVAHAMMGIEA